jgi:hypothetical protein
MLAPIFSRSASITAVLMLLLSGPAPVHGQPGSVWKDLAPHRTLGISVAPRIKLEVLDWGGQGAPLIFLAGGGNTAHVYDGLAT